MNEQAIPDTPAAEWRVKGEDDPHPWYRGRTRAELGLGTMTDDQLANLVSDGYAKPMDIERLMKHQGADGYHPPISIAESAKDRIRWLSRQLCDAEAKIAIMKGVGIEEPVLPTPPINWEARHDAIAASFGRQKEMHQQEIAQLQEQIDELKMTRPDQTLSSASVSKRVRAYIADLRKDVENWNRSGRTRLGAIMQSIDRLEAGIARLERQKDA